MKFIQFWVKFYASVPALAQESRGHFSSTQMCACLFEPGIRSFTGLSIFRHTEENAEDMLTYPAHVWNWKAKSWSQLI